MDNFKIVPENCDCPPRIITGDPDEATGNRNFDPEIIAQFGLGIYGAYLSTTSGNNTIYMVCAEPYDGSPEPFVNARINLYVSTTETPTSVSDFDIIILDEDIDITAGPSDTAISLDADGNPIVVWTANKRNTAPTIPEQTNRLNVAVGQVTNPTGIGDFDIYQLYDQNDSNQSCFVDCVVNDENDLYVIAQDPTTNNDEWHIYYGSLYESPTITWNNHQLNSSSSSVDLRPVAIEFDNTVLHVLYGEGAVANGKVYYGVSNDNTPTSLLEWTITEVEADHTFPTITYTNLFQINIVPFETTKLLSFRADSLFFIGENETGLNRSFGEDNGSTSNKYGGSPFQSLPTYSYYKNPMSAATVYYFDIASKKGLEDHFGNTSIYLDSFQFDSNVEVDTPYPIVHYNINGKLYCFYGKGVEYTSTTIFREIYFVQLDNLS